MNPRSWLCLLAVLLSPSSVWAGGFSTARFGGEEGHPTTSNPTAIYYNPAGLVLGPAGTRFYVEGLAAYHTASYQRPVGAIDNVVSDGGAESGTPASAVAANAGTAELAGFLASPFAAVVSDLGVPNLAVAAGFYVPLGGDAKWDQNPDFADHPTFPGAVDGVQRWAVIEASLRSYYFTAAGAYRLPDLGLSFGVGANLVMNDISFLQARTTAATDNMVTASGSLLEGRALIEADNLTFSLSAGVIWQPDQVTWLGLSYQSQPGFGETEMSGELTAKFGAGAIDVTAIDFIQALPDVIRFGARRRFGPAELRFAADYSRWSQLDKQCLIAATPGANCALTANGGVAPEGLGIIINTPRNFQDTFGVRLGGAYFPTSRLELGGSVTFDSNAIPDETLDATIIDMNKLIFQIGARHTLPGDRMELSFTLGQVVYFEREVDVRARDADGAAITFDAPTRKPDGAGIYDQSVTLGIISVAYGF